MSRSVFQPEWRTQSRRKRRFYARYMGWLEKVGFVVVTLLLAAFAGSFFYEVDEWVSAEEVAIEAEEVTIFAPTAGTIVKLAEPGSAANGQFLIETAKGPNAGDGVDHASWTHTGLFYPAEGLAAGQSIEKGAPIGVIRNYDRLVVRPKLAGKSISKAAAGQDAELTNIRIQAEGDTLLRANMDGRTAVSRGLAGTAVKDALNAALKGKTVSAREDVPLQIESVTDVEIEASLKTSAAATAEKAFDPSPTFKLRGKVRDGKHVLSAQLGDLPPDVQQAATEALKRQLQGKAIEIDGRPQTIEDILDPRFIVRLNAEGAAAKRADLSAAQLKRTYDALIELNNVPPNLVERLKEAHRQGKQVTAKVQVRTGSRPIAYFLLRRS